jgi:hypothetical protein
MDYFFDINIDDFQDHLLIIFINKNVLKGA